jgi:hypothetical protein
MSPTAAAIRTAARDTPGTRTASPQTRIAASSRSGSLWSRRGSPPVPRRARFVSLAVLASAIVVALGLNIGDPIIGLAINLVILRITWQSFQTVRNDPGEHHDPDHDEPHPTPADHDRVAPAHAKR